LSKVYIEIIEKKELTLDLKSNNEILNQEQKFVKNGDGIIVKVSKEQMEEYKKFLKKNVSNSFALD
jgi:hypothetical protein